MNLKFNQLAQQILGEGYYTPTGTGHGPSRSLEAFKSRERNAGLEKETNKIRITTKEGKKKFYSVGGTVKTYPGTKAGMDQANAACERLKAQDWVSDAVVVAG
jgi:hypothetical protein